MYTMRIHCVTCDEQKNFFVKVLTRLQTFHAVSRGGSSLFVTDESPLFVVTFTGSPPPLPPASVVTAISVIDRKFLVCSQHFKCSIIIYAEQYDSPLLHESSISVILKRNTRPAGSRCFHFSILIR